MSAIEPAGKIVVLRRVQSGHGGALQTGLVIASSRKAGLYVIQKATRLMSSFIAPLKKTAAGR